MAELILAMNMTCVVVNVHTMIFAFRYRVWRAVIAAAISFAGCLAFTVYEWTK